ncbi:hypothetical protein GF389_06250 [Candidatus Dojkabacteria bacterium]|nr:hypothetical protein [Candidatus Dojkabacteria bacterium]
MGQIAKEVQQEIVAKIKSGIPATKLSKDYGVHVQTIYSWLRKSVSGPSYAELNKYKRENTQLKELIGELTMRLQKHEKRGK